MASERPRRHAIGAAEAGRCRWPPAQSCSLQLSVRAAIKKAAVEIIIAYVVKWFDFDLALQLRFSFEMSAAGLSLVSASPE